MEVLIIGDLSRRQELKEQASEQVTLTEIDSTAASQPPGSMASYDAIFDLTADDNPAYIPHYIYNEGQPVFMSAVKQQLASMLANYLPEVKCLAAGINALPTFLRRDRLELSYFDASTHKTIKQALEPFSWQVEEIEDRTGMVTPRIVFMIINEACFTLQEGTADISDINTAMKRGTNYPRGPFEWADATGIDNVYETLEAVYQDTHDERYKVCPLLKTKYLMKETFMDR